MRSGTSASGTRGIRIATASRGRALRSASSRTTSWSSRWTARPSTPQAASPTPSGSSTVPSTRRAPTSERSSTITARALIPFAITGAPLRPVMHMCASMGARYPGLGLANELRRHEPPRDGHADGPGSRGRARRSSCRADARARVRRRRRLAARGRLQCDLSAAERGSAAQGVGVGRDHLPERWRDRGGACGRGARSPSSAHGSTGASAPAARTTSGRWKDHWPGCDRCAMIGSNVSAGMV